MSLTPGSRLGPYEIVAAIGAGGMGEAPSFGSGDLNDLIELLADFREQGVRHGPAGVGSAPAKGGPPTP